MTGVSKSITINAPIESVFEIISNFEDYPQFLPDVENVTIKKKTEKTVIATFTLNLMVKIKYTLKLKLNKPTEISWTLHDGQMMKHNNGAWNLKKLSDTKTKATYSVDIGFGPFVPKSIVNTLVGNNLPNMLKNFKERIES